MDRKLLSLRCDPEKYSTLLWPPAMCNHSCIRQELACYSYSMLHSVVVAHPNAQARTRPDLRVYNMDVSILLEDAGQVLYPGPHHVLWY